MTDDELVIVFEGNLPEVDIVKSILDSEGITCFLKDNYMGTFAPYYTSIGGASPIKIVIPKSELQKVKSLIEEYDKKR